MWTKKTAGAYLAGVIDADGTVSLVPNRNVVITNTDWDIIRAASACLEVLNIDHSIYERPRSNERHSNFMRIYIGGRGDLQKLYDNVPLHCSKKHRRLENILNTYVYEPISQEILVDLYYEKEMSQRHIAKLLGRSLRTIQNWMKKYNLMPRSRDEAIALYHSRVQAVGM